jgi:hypothetical protein
MINSASRERGFLAEALRVDLLQVLQGAVRRGTRLPPATFSGALAARYVIGTR